jgi:hypothetical protein
MAALCADVAQRREVENLRLEPASVLGVVRQLILAVSVSQFAF